MAVLRNGAKGEQVEALQRQLQGQGFNPGKIDGVFGPKTEDALKRFQEKAGLTADGIAGAKTFTSLVKMSKKVDAVGSAAKRSLRDRLTRRSSAKKQLEK